MGTALVTLVVTIFYTSTWQQQHYDFESFEACHKAIQESKATIPNGAENEVGISFFCVQKGSLNRP